MTGEDEEGLSRWCQRKGGGRESSLLKQRWAGGMENTNHRDS